MIQPIQIAVATDDGYAVHLTVMLLSLFERGGQQPFRVHALVPGGFKSKPQITSSLGNHAASVIFHQIDADKVAHLKTRSDITNATYYRLLMADLLPSEIDRVIYLDCDMLVCGPLLPLWETDLGSTIIGAVPDPGFTQQSVLGLSPSDPYFNAGMLLVDLKRWREANIGLSALEFAEACPHRLSFNDQCALNWVLRGNWQQLPSKWNVQAFMLGDMKRGYFWYRRGLRYNLSDARIVHFNEPGRPWRYLDEHPLKPDYLGFRARTPWAGEPLADRHPHNMIVKSLRRNAPFLLPAYLQVRKFI